MSVRSTRSGANTRNKILIASTTLFAEKGFDGVALRDIAKACALPLSTLCHHFASKAALQGAVMIRAHEVATDISLAATASSGTPRERIRHYIKIWVSLLLSNHPEMQLIDREFQSSGKGPTGDIWMRTFYENSAATSGLEDLIRDTCSPLMPDIAAKRLAQMLFSLLYGVTKLRPFHRQDQGAALASSDEIAAEIILFFESALRVNEWPHA